MMASPPIFEAADKARVAVKASVGTVDTTVMSRENPVSTLWIWTTLPGAADGALP